MNLFKQAVVFLKAARRRSRVIGTIGLVAVIVLVIALRSRSAKDVGPAASDQRRGNFDIALDDARKVSGFVGSYGRRIDEAEARLRLKDQELGEVRGKMDEQSSRIAHLIESLKSFSSMSSRGSDPGSTPDESAGGRIQKYSLGPQARATSPTVRIPAGSFAEATLLTGVYAPTDAAALPVELRLDEVLIGPNRSRIPIAGALLIGKAVGDPNSLRAIVQITKLSYVSPEGKSVEVLVNGYVADRDGVQGMAGAYVWRIPEAATTSALAGALSAGSEAVASGELTNGSSSFGSTTTALTGDPMRFALAKGAGQTTSEISKIVARRLEEITPAIHVPNGRKLTVLFLDGFDLTGVSVAQLTQTSSRNPYAGTDSDR